MNKKDLLTVKELAAENDSLESRKFPADDGTQRTKPHASSQWQRDTAGRDRRPRPAARRAIRPRLVTRGHYPQGSLQEV